MIKHHEQKQLGQEGRGLLPFTVNNPSWGEVRAEIQSRNLEAGIEAEAMEEC